MLLAERHESERLRQIIKQLQRHRFGRKAETLPEEQMLLGLEDVQQVAACTEAGQDQTAPEGRAERARRRRGNRGALPAHLPRTEVVVDIDDKTCPCCKGDLHQIGEDRSERLDIVPAQFRVVVTRRPKYACRGFTRNRCGAGLPASGRCCRTRRRSSGLRPRISFDPWHQAQSQNSLFAGSDGGAEHWAVIASLEHFRF